MRMDPKMDPRIGRKKEKEGIRLQILGFLGDGFGVKEKKKGRHGQIVSDRHGNPLVLYIKSLSLCVHPMTFRNRTRLSVR
jgi:hypothetical protein